MDGRVETLNHFEIAGYSSIDDGGTDHISIHVDGSEVAVVPADRVHQDKREKGVAPTKSGFKFAFPETPAMFRKAVIEVRSKTSGELLPNGRRTLIPLLDGAGPYRHSLARPAFSSGRAVTLDAGDRVGVNARVLASADEPLSVVSVPNPWDSNPTAVVERLRITPVSVEDIPAGAPCFQDLAWSFDRRLLAGSTVALFQIQGAEPDGTSDQDKLLAAARTICIPLQTDWFTLPPEENYKRTSGPRANIRTMLVAATNQAYKLHLIADALLPKRAGLSIVDWGVGFGRTAMTIKRLFNPDAQVIGFDIDPVNVGWATANIPDVDVRQCDLYPPLPIPDGSVDFLYAISVMTHLTEATQEVWLRELRRVMKPGGVLVLTTRSDHMLILQQVRQPDVLRQLARYGLSDALPDGNLGPLLETKSYYRGTIQLRQQVEQTWSRHFEIVSYLPYSFGQDAVVMRRV